MSNLKINTVEMLYGPNGCKLALPASADILTTPPIPALDDPRTAIAEALAAPIESKPLTELLKLKRPKNAAITISDITRPVPNRDFLPSLLEILNINGVGDDAITIVVGTGMHRASTPAEHLELIGAEVLARCRVIDHRAEKPETLVAVSDGRDGHPPVSVCREFAEADFKIVTGYIEPHFMAGFSGGRKGICPALVDLATVQRFHGYATLANPLADNGRLVDNPCHEESLRVARLVGVDFLFNVAINQQRRIAGVFCGDLEAAHAAGCTQVADWTSVRVEEPYDLVITNGGGYPLDQSFYQSVKGQCTALPAVRVGGALLQLTHCGEGLGSPSYAENLLKWGHDWQGFLDHIAGSGVTELDQWQIQMQCRVLKKIGLAGLRVATDGLDADTLARLPVMPVVGAGSAVQRAQEAIDAFISDNPAARVAIIPEGPYTMIRSIEQ